MPGAYTEVQIGLNTKNWDVYNQTNDYSFNGTVGGFCETVIILAYLAGSWPGGSNREKKTPPQPAGIMLMEAKTNLMTILGRMILKFTTNVLPHPSMLIPLQHNVKLINSGGQNIDSKRVKLRYWFTKEPQSQQTASIYWSNVGANNVTASFHALAVPLPDADHYLELGFKEGSLLPGANVEIKLGFNTKDWSDYYQQNDYSFDPKATTYTENPCYTGYLNDALVWGDEPLLPGATYCRSRLLLAFADSR